MSRNDDFRNGRTPWEDDHEITSQEALILTHNIEELYDIAADNRRQADRLWVVLIFLMCLVSAIALYLWIK